MKNLQFILPVVLLLCTTSHLSQSAIGLKKIEESAGIAKESSENKSQSKAGVTRKDYDKAEQLAIEAQKQLIIGEVPLADSLINASIELYPTLAIFQYAKTLNQMSDFSTANALVEKAYLAVERFSTSQILVLEPFASQYIDGKMVALVKEYDINRALLLFGFQADNLNKEFGGFNTRKVILEKLVKLSINERAKTIGTYDFEYNQLQMYKWDYEVVIKNYDKAIELIKKMPISASRPLEVQYNFIAYVYFEKGDYENSLKFVEKLTGAYAFAQDKFKFMTYAMMGDVEKAEKSFSKLRVDGIPIVNDEFYYQAMVNIKKGDFKGALTNLDSTLSFRIKGMGDAAGFALVDRWKVYKLYGDAYAGLQQYEKARDNYDISLMANPDYEPAIDALANLEMLLAKETALDKNPPQIKLTSPDPSRGFKLVSAAGNVLIKGTAFDISGIREVSINDKIVYSQRGGEFWGEIALQEGINKVAISATDYVGNKAVQVFDIERLPETVAATIVEKSGYNYCLLIAAQNYTDSNIPSLSNPVGDAIKLKLVLKSKYNFSEENIFTLFNPETTDVKRQLLELTNKLNPEDNLLIFYAGHGIWVEKEKKGYWLLTDSQRFDENTWLPNKTVLDLIAKIPSRHTLLITDACFSGSVFKTRGLTDAPAIIKDMETKISRVAITSGNDTEVPDESVFMKYLIKALSENTEKYVTAQKMFINQIIEAVMTETNTEPRYGTLELAGHVGGDYVFNKK